jgi:hypothetical protein
MVIIEYSIVFPKDFPRKDILRVEEEIKRYAEEENIGSIPAIDVNTYNKEIPLEDGRECWCLSLSILPIVNSSQEKVMKELGYGVTGVKKSEEVCRYKERKFEEKLSEKRELGDIQIWIEFDLDGCVQTHLSRLFGEKQDGD